MPRPVIIEIPDAETLNWDDAVELWKQHAGRHGSTGHNCNPTYAWYLIDPKTKLPCEETNHYNCTVLHHPIGKQETRVVEVTPTEEVAELREAIDALASALYKMKRDMQKMQKVPSSTKVAAIQKNLDVLYTRWSVLPTKAGC